MCGLMLVRPCKLYAEQVMSYKEEMSQNGDSFDGCAGLEDVYSFDEWIDFEGRLRKKYKTGYVPSEVFLAVRQSDKFLVGMIDFRHPLSDFLKNYSMMFLIVLPLENNSSLSKFPCCKAFHTFCSLSFISFNVYNSNNLFEKPVLGILSLGWMTHT